MLEIILIGIGLSMDAFAVTLSDGLAYPDMTKKQKISLPLAFGIFQGIMPILGYFLGSFFSIYIEKYAGIISLVILGVIGINMIKEAFEKDEEKETPKFTFLALIVQAIATSIDAFAVGFDFSLKKAEIFSSSATIALTTFIFTFVALAVGKKFGEILGKRAQILGGVILIAIGIKSIF